MNKEIQINSDIDIEKIKQDFKFLEELSLLSEKNGWRMVVTGGYGLDIYIGKTTRNHGDIDVVFYGQNSREVAVGSLAKALESNIPQPKINVKSETFFENIDIYSSKIVANLYYVQTANNPHLDIYSVIKSNGDTVKNNEERFPPPVIGSLYGISYEVEDPNSHLADILHKQKTQPHKSTHIQDIANLVLITDNDKVKSIMKQV